jgi:diacylglycerol kinase (ATP)
MVNYITKLVNNLNYSLRGISLCLKEPSFQMALAYAVILFPSLLFSHADIAIKTLGFVLYLLTIAIELLNTAIEQVCNKITQAQDEQIRNIKDISSAAVFVLALSNLAVLIKLWY